MTLTVPTTVFTASSPSRYGQRVPDAKDWLPAFIAALAVVTAAFITLRGRAGPSRPREDALKEQELLSKLDPDSDEARQLREVLKARIASWHAALVPKAAPVPRSRAQNRDLLLDFVRYTLAGVVAGATLIVLSFVAINYLV